MEVSGIFDTNLALEGERLKEAMGVWLAARGDRRMPARQDIDPAKMPRHLLPHLELVDVAIDPEPQFRWRLIGTHVTAAVGRDATGLHFHELYAGADFETVCGPFAWVMEHAAPLRWHGTSGFIGRDWLAYEGVYLPLSNDQETVNMVLAAVQYDLP